MANGEGERWGNYLGVPKHLIKIDNECIIFRTIRLLKQYINEDDIIMINAHNDLYKVDGTIFYTSKSECEIDKFALELLEDNVCYVYGDCYYTEEAIKTIVNTNTDNITLFGRNVVNEVKPNYGELFAYKIKDSRLFKEKVSYLREECMNGRNRGDGWELFVELKCEFVLINDESDDFDFPYDYDNWLKVYRKKNIKVAMYYYRIEALGGVEKVILTHSKYLFENGYDVTVIFTDFNSGFDMLNKISDYATVKHSSYDVEEYFDYCLYQTIYRSGVINSRNNIQIVHCDWDYCNVKREHIPNDCNKYISTGVNVKKQVDSMLNINSPMYQNIIDLDEIKIKAQEIVDVKTNGIVFVTVARISKEKGFTRILDIIKMLIRKKVEFTWLVVGDGDNNIKKLFDEYKNNVIFLGRKENPYPYIKLADYLVQLSDIEVQCLVIFEALLLGTPIIATNFKSAIDIVKKDNGFILQKDLSDLTTNKLNKILNSKFKNNFTYNYYDYRKEWLSLFENTNNTQLDVKSKNKDYFISVIVPNYNNAKYLEKCINSVLSQTYTNYEIIYVDDMSTDNSVSIAKKLLVDKKHSIIKLKSKRYNGGARNEGILKAKGDYIVCIDSDDYLANDNVLEKINSSLYNQDVLFLGFQMYNNEGLLGKHIPNYTTRAEALCKNVCAIWTKVVKTKIMKECLFSEGTLMEDKVHHFYICNKMKTFSCLKEITHMWNRGNVDSVSTKRSIKWDTSQYRYIADLIEFYEICDLEFKNYILGRIQNAKRNAEKGLCIQE